MAPLVVDLRTVPESWKWAGSARHGWRCLFCRSPTITNRRSSQWSGLLATNFAFTCRPASNWRISPGIVVLLTIFSSAGVSLLLSLKKVQTPDSLFTPLSERWNWHREDTFHFQWNFGMDLWLSLCNSFSSFQPSLYCVRLVIFGRTLEEGSGIIYSQKHFGKI